MQSFHHAVTKPEMKYDRPSKIVQNWCYSKAAINALEIIATEITS
jgi:hypothetical protein